MQVILLAPGTPLPSRTAKHRKPVVRRCAVRLGICPDIPTCLRIVSTLAALLKPGMFVGGVRQDQINNDLDTAFMGAGDQDAEVCVRPKDRINGPIICDVASEIAHRRFVKRRDPDGINTECLDVIEVSIDTSDIPGSIAVSVKEASRIDLIDNCSSPPFRLHGFALGGKRADVNGANGRWGETANGRMGEWANEATRRKRTQWTLSERAGEDATLSTASTPSTLST